MGLRDRFDNAVGDIKNADASATSWVATNAKWIVVGALVIGAVLFASLFL